MFIRSTKPHLALTQPEFPWEDSTVGFDPEGNTLVTGLAATDLIE